MDIRYLQSMIKVVELGSIAQAARDQNLTPAAIGQRIIMLEKHFKTELLNRSLHKAIPTEACLNLLPRARKIVEEFQQLNAEINPTGLEGKFHIGAISTALTGILPTAVRHLAEKAPGLILQIKPGTSNSLFADLAEGRIDAAIIATPPYVLPKKFHSQVLRQEPLVLISKQAKGKTIRQKLIQNPYICYDSQSWGGLKARQYLKDKKIPVKPLYELDALEAIEKLVLQGMGVSLVPLWAGLELSNAEIDAEIIKGDVYRRNVIFVTKVANTRGVIVEALMEALAV